eukprot:s322_g17.t1
MPPESQSQVAAHSDPPSKYLDSWAKKTSDGKGICIRFNTGRCKSGKARRYAHAQSPMPKECHVVASILLASTEVLDGVPGNSVEQQLAVQESATVHDRARLLLSAVSRNNGLLILENPATSMTWLDDLMFGADWAKTWCFVSNKSDILALGLSCDHGPNSHESVVGVRLRDGTFKSRLTAHYSIWSVCGACQMADLAAFTLVLALSFRSHRRWWWPAQYCIMPWCHGHPSLALIAKALV